MRSQKILFTILILATLLIAGCADPKPTDEEIYTAAWVLHNINDTTPTTLEINPSEIARYTFTHNFPGSAPEYYTSVLFFSAPNEEMLAAGNIDVPSPFKQTIYSYTTNPVPQNYKRRFGLERYVNLNYFKASSEECGAQFMYDNHQQERIVQSIWDSPYPNPGENKEFIFGGPYIPVSVKVEDFIQARGRLLQGRTGSYITKLTETGATCFNFGTGEIREVRDTLRKPQYEIYEDGTLIRQGTLTNEGPNYAGGWNTNLLNTNVQENKTYLVNITIPSDFPVFNNTLVTAEFSTLQADRGPPWLEDLLLPVSFSQGENLPLMIKANDENQVNSTEAWFRIDEGAWQQITLTQLANTSSGTIPASGNMIDLLVKITDTSGNTQSYLINPVSLNKQALSIEVTKTPDIVSPGTLLNIKGKIKDPQGKGVNNLLIEAQYNNNPLKKTYTLSPYATGGNETRRGEFNIIFEVPQTFQEGDTITLLYGAAGIYPQSQHTLTSFAQIFDADLAVLDIKVPEIMFSGENQINVTIANIGRTALTGDLLLTNGYDIRETRTVSLVPGEVKEESFNLFLEQGYLDLSAEIIASGDQNPNNNNKSKFVRVVSEIDIGINIIWPGNVEVNQSKTFSFRIYNNGVKPVYDINYTIGYQKAIPNSIPPAPSPGGPGGGSPGGISASAEPEFIVIETGIIPQLNRREEIEKSVSVTFNELGDYILRAWVNASNDFYLNNNENSLYLTVREPGADLYGYIYTPPIVVNEANQINVDIFNSGTRATENGNIKIYINNGYCYYPNGDCNTLTLLDSRDINIPAAASATESFTWTPTELGDYSVIIILNATNEINPQDNIQTYSVSARPRGSDLYGYINLETGIVNEPNGIALYLYNDGSEDTTNATLALYYQKEYCDYSLGECQNLTLIASKDIEIASGRGITDQFSWTPGEEGRYTFLLILNATNEVYPQNNIRDNFIDVKRRGSDLFLSFTTGKAIVNESNNITVRIFNYGSAKTAGATLLVETAKGICAISSSCQSNFIPIASKNIEVNVGDFLTELIPWTPQEEGYYTIRVRVNATNEISPQDNVYRLYINVQLPGPDPFISFLDIPQLIKNIASTLFAGMSNRGTESAQNIQVSLYESDSKEGTENFINSQTIPTLAPEEETTLNIPYTPLKKARFMIIKANLTADNDTNLLNNEYNSYAFIANDGKDAAVNLWASECLILNKPSSISGNVENLGNQLLDNINLSFYIDNIFVEKQFIPAIPYQPYYLNSEYFTFIFTPTSLGEKNFKVRVDLDGDIDLSDNEMNLTAAISTRKNITLSMQDSQGSRINRTFLTLDCGEQFYPITNLETEIEVADRPMQIALIDKAVSSENELVTEFSAIIIENANLSENATIISDAYDRIQQNMTNHTVDYYAVFANKFSFNYTSAISLIILDDQKIARLGLDANYLEDYDTFYCEDFNSLRRECNQEWKQPMSSDVEVYGSRLFVEAFFPTNSSNLAFAIGESKRFDGATTVLGLSPDNAENFILEKQRHGRIKFSRTVDISRFKEDSTLLENYVTIASKRIHLDINQLPEFRGIPAQLLFRNIDLRNPQILHNGKQCPSSVCISIVYDQSAQTMIVNITNFSEFTIIEGPYCGDNVCLATTESCSNCVSDCGSCPTTPPPTPPSPPSPPAPPSPKKCTPNWDCKWGPCSNNVRRFLCADINRCGTNAGKPAESTQSCFVEGNCTDKDKDGYGIGKDCLGPDSNDNDPAVNIPPQKLNPPQQESKLTATHYALIAIGLFIFLSILIVFLIVIIKKMQKPSDQYFPEATDENLVHEA